MTKQQKGKTSAGQQRRSARPEQMHASRQHPQKRSSKVQRECGVCVKRE